MGVVYTLLLTLCDLSKVSRSKINDRAGARTQMACLVAGFIALLAILFLLPYFHYLPKAVLSSIIFVAVLSLLFELPEDLHFIFKLGAWKDLGLLLITFFSTLIISLEFGTLLAVTLSLLVTIRETSYPRISIMVCLNAYVHIELYIFFTMIRLYIGSS
jgi:MFS superfamily sulfate permease-like transporter